MGKVTIDEETLDGIGRAIIAKGGTSDTLLPSEMPAAIAAIPSGGEWVMQPWVMSESDPTKLDGWIHLWFQFTYDTAATAYFSAQFISSGHTFTVDWGDGTVATIAASASYVTRSLSHTYATAKPTGAGFYHVKIYGYDSARFNQVMFTSDVNRSNTDAMLGIRQMQLGTFDGDTGFTARIHAKAVRAATWDGDVKSFGGGYTFAGCSSLVSVGDLSACTSVPIAAFQNCSSLVSVGDLSACTSIGNTAFGGCSSLVLVGDLSACTSIISHAFDGCSSLASVGDLPSCTSIDSWAFQNCSSLASVGDLSACTSIGATAFGGCSSLASLTFLTKTHTEVESITGFANFPDRGTACIFHCSDGDYYRSGGSLLPVEA